MRGMAQHRELSDLWSSTWGGNPKKTGNVRAYTHIQQKLTQHLNHSLTIHCCCSVTQSCLTLQSYGLQHARPPCPSPTPGAYSDSCPLSQWWHPAISSSVVPFSSCLQTFPASGSFLVSLFTSGGKSIEASASASIFPISFQDFFFPLGLTGWISL